MSNIGKIYEFSTPLFKSLGLIRYTFLPKLHLFDQKYSYNYNNVEYYNLKLRLIC